MITVNCKYTAPARDWCQHEHCAHAYPLCHCDPVLDAGVGDPVAVATAVRRRMFNPIEIATWFDRLTMSGYAPRNDGLKWVRVRNIVGISRVVWRYSRAPWLDRALWYD